MEIGSLAQIGSLAIATLAVVISVLGSSRKGWEERIKVVAEAAAEATDQAGALADRVTRLERDMEHLPDNETAHRMEMAIVRLEGRLETMDERLKPVASIATRMQEILMEKN
ncbi:hypothetical protein [Prosthecodimorpha staleyi]|uniref:DUF2730 family protein n=1 Tax=Prosthecodimorpha staleyi TaxID=2840188 RepID=A0A947D9W7_9HYPH|nr:hypothetical protein [Prosthecodimorpha staleyi]MBT9293318.1 hypothetical protein [Prosthecodimorpha staleyi]